MGYIYKITNLVNNKIYVGQTVSSINKRFNDHLYNSLAGFRDAPLLSNAIKKYGKENFIVEMIEHCENEKLDEQEIYWINKLKSHYSYGHGYNISLGGQSGFLYDSEKILMLWNEGYTITEIALKLDICFSTVSDRINDFISKDEIKKRQYSKIKIPVSQYDLYGNFINDYDSAASASKMTGCNANLINRCCNKTLAFTNNYFFKFKDDPTPIENFITTYAKSSHCCEVNMIDKNTNKVIKTYKSARQASLDLGIGSGSISRVCNHKKGAKTAGGYKWEWAYEPKRRLIEDETQ